jgi:hypothetical protein
MKGIPTVEELKKRSQERYNVLFKEAISKFENDFKIASDEAVEKGEFSCKVKFDKQYANRQIKNQIIKELESMGFRVTEECQDKNGVFTITWKQDFSFLPELIPLLKNQ